MIKPTLIPITASYTEGGDNTAFYTQEVAFSEDLLEAADYVEHGIEVVGTYVETKAFFDEMLNDGNYLNDLLAYENRILEYYNEAYGLNETVVTDGIVNNLSAKEMEALTIPLTLAVVFAEHNAQVISYFQQFRGDATNAEVYNAIVAYLQPLQQGISRILSLAAVQVFTQGTDAYNDLTAWSDVYKDQLITAINSQIDLSVKIADANAVDVSLDGHITTGSALSDALVTNTAAANNINTTLGATITGANSTKTLLTNANATATVTKDELNDLILASDIPALQARVTANDAKVSNVPTSLSIGTVTSTTVAITSDGGADDMVLPSSTPTEAGLMSAEDKQKINSSVLVSGAVMTGPITALRETKIAVPASAIDLSVGNLFTKTIAGATTFTVANTPATGQAAHFVLELTNAGSAIITWWTGIKWAGGTAPTLTTAGVDILGFYSHDGGTTWRGVVMVKDSK